MLARIRALVWSDRHPLSVEWAGCSSEHVPLKEARQRKLRPVKKPFFWGELEDQAWFRITIPAGMSGGDWHLEWKEQGESTAYIGGMPYAGLDVAHLRCKIPAKCREIWMEVMAMENGMWRPDEPGRPAITPEGCRFEGAWACRRDPLAWDVVHDFHVLLNLLEDEYRRQPQLHTPFARAVGYTAPLDNVSVLYRRLARHLEDAMLAFERGGLEAASRSLKAAYDSLAGHGDLVKCRLTGHAHIDLVWLWTEKAGEFKAVHTFSTINRLMDDYPEFRFGYSQPASYRAVERRAPLLMKAVRERIREGRWEAVGASEVESDTMLACGEGLVRSLLLGQEGFRDLNGKPSEVLWLPDVFGYTAALPQILAQTGVKYFFTTKLHWGSVTLFPYSSFIWQGSDGAEILAHVSQGMGYNMNVTPGEIRSAVREYRQADIHDELLMPSGFGDGGGGPTAEMCERARRLRDLAGCPSTNWGRIDEYFHGLEKVRKRLPAYRGELYLQYHRGVLTTHGDLKAAFRGLERALQAREAAHAVVGAGPIPKDAWRRLVFAQFHDYIPGSSVPSVYREALPELRALAEEARSEAVRCLGSGSRTQCLFNPLPMPRIVVHQGSLLRLPPLAGKPVDSLEVVDGGDVRASSSVLESRRVRVRFDRGGRVREITVDGRKVASAGALADLIIYPDFPHAFEAWDVDRSTLASGKSAPRAEFLAAESGQAVGVVKFRCALTPQSTAEIHYILEAASPVLRIEYHILWNDPNTLLKVVFPTKYQGNQARFGDPFGSSLRSQHPGKPYDEAQWEVAGSRWAVVADDGGQEGLFVVTESKYGWSARSGTLGLSLLRSTAMPSSGLGAVETGDAYSKDFSDLKPHTIRLAVGLFRAEWPREEMPAALADILFTPAVVYRGAEKLSGFLGLEGGESLVPCWAKPEEDGAFTIRLHETLGRRGRALVHFAAGWQVRRVNLSGDPWPTPLRERTVDFQPYEVVSLQFSPV